VKKPTKPRKKKQHFEQNLFELTMVKKTEQSTRTSVSSLWSAMVQRKLSLSE